MSSPPSKRVKIWTDGACLGNPGPGGWAAVIDIAGEQQKIAGRAALTTNNRMELTAVIKAIAKVGAKFSILIYSDSNYVIKGATSWLQQWKLKKWRNSTGKEVANRDLWEKLDQLIVKNDIKWQWVKGHSNITENEICHNLAQQQARNDTAPLN